MELFLSALGLAMIFEGIPYFALPNQIKKLAKQLPSLSNHAIRTFGITVMACGLIIIYVARNLF